MISGNPTHNRQNDIIKDKIDLSFFPGGVAQMTVIPKFWIQEFLFSNYPQVPIMLFMHI